MKLYSKNIQFFNLFYRPTVFFKTNITENVWIHILCHALFVFLAACWQSIWPDVHIPHGVIIAISSAGGVGGLCNI